MTTKIRFEEGIHPARTLGTEQLEAVHPKIVESSGGSRSPYFNAVLLGHRLGLDWTELPSLATNLMEIASLSWAADWASYFKIEDLFECACVALNECGSPIEQLFLSALLVGKHGWKLLGLLESFDLTPGVPGGAIALHQAGLRLTQQFEAGPYRLDFAILPASSLIGIAIELDGHDFHERTKQQAQRDKARDRYLASQGWRVLRFTGSEVWRDPHKCASEATTIACSLTADRKELA